MCLIHASPRLCMCDLGGGASGCRGRHSVHECLPNICWYGCSLMGGGADGRDLGAPRSLPSNAVQGPRGTPDLAVRRQSSVHLLAGGGPRRGCSLMPRLVSPPGPRHLGACPWVRAAASRAGSPQDREMAVVVCGCVPCKGGRGEVAHDGRNGTSCKLAHGRVRSSIQRSPTRGLEREA